MRALGNIMSRRWCWLCKQTEQTKDFELLSKLQSQVGGPGCSLWAYLMAHAKTQQGAETTSACTFALPQTTSKAL